MLLVKKQGGLLQQYLCLCHQKHQPALLRVNCQDPKNNIPVGQAITEGILQLKNSIKEARNYANIYRFLLARMIYNDAVILIYAFGGIYAAGTFGMDESQIIIFGIGLNVTAALGAVGFSWMDDRSGSKKTILFSLIGLIIPVTAILFVEDIFWFWIWGLMLGVFFGPVQAASRTLMGRLAPEDKRTEMFGLFAFSGKATAFIGPKLLFPQIRNLLVLAQKNTTIKIIQNSTPISTFRALSK